MMLVFRVTDRVVEVDETQNLIGYNSDYTAEFSFDAEWDGKIKTARFEQSDGFTDVVLENDACTIPPLKMGRVKVGVFSDDMTTTPVELIVNESIKDISGNPKDPTLDVYGQLIKMIESGMSSGGSGGGNDNIMFVHLTLDISTDPARYACDTKKGDVCNALDNGKLVYAVATDGDTASVYMAQKVSDGNVMFAQYYIIGHALTMDFYEQDYETTLVDDADGLSWKFVEYNYSLTLV